MEAVTAKHFVYGNTIYVAPMINRFDNLDDYLNCELAQNAINGLRKTLSIAVKERVCAQPLFCKDCIKNQWPPGPLLVG